MLVSVSKGVDSYFTWLSQSQRRTIYNPFFNPHADKDSRADSITSEWLNNLSGNERVIVSMGRFTYQKGFDLLLKSFAGVSGGYPDWRLIILGDGELRGELEQLVEDLDLKDRVDLPGRVSDPFIVLKLSLIHI